MENKNKFTLNEVLDTLKEKKLNRDEYSLLCSDFETQVGKKGYLQFRLTEKDKWKNVHTLVNQYFNSEEHNKKYTELVETSVEKWLVTHHVNFFEKENKLNNHPDNLQWMGFQEHINYHGSIMREIVDKIWNPENPEYCNNEVQREKIRLTASKNGKKSFEELWHGEQNEEYREKMKLVQSVNMSKLSDVIWNGEGSEERREKQGELMKSRIDELWYGEGNEEYRKKMLPIQIENGKKVLNELWHGENNKEYREKMRPTQSKHALEMSYDFWYGEGNEQRRANKTKQASELLNELWHGEGSEKFRKEHIKRVNDPIIKQKMLEGRVFGEFNKIILVGENITDETFLEYKPKFSAYPETVFGSIEIAIEKYQDYPKRIKV